MSHMVTRKGPVGDDKEKRQTDSPVKEMKKKIAANAEKEKQAAEKSAEKEKTEKTTEKPADKKEKATDKQTDKSEKKDKTEKPGEKSTDKKEKIAEKNVEKAADKKEKRDKSAEKVVEKPAEKKDKPSEKAADKKEKTDKKDGPEKSKDEAGTAEKSGKQDKPEEPKTRKPETVKHNGNQNGAANGAGSSSDDDELIIVEQAEDNDEMFPELAYDDNSDADGFEPDTAAARSLTRRSQVKAARTPETPRPASAVPVPRDDHSKEPKVLRLKEDALTDRRLRSAGSPKPTGKDSPKKSIDSPSKSEVTSKAEVTSKSEVTSKVEVTSKAEVTSKSEVTSKPEVIISDVTNSDVTMGETVTIVVENAPEAEEKTEKSEKSEMEVVIEVESSEDGDTTRRDTRYSRSRVKVSPYRRSARLADASVVSLASHTSLVANYTGNNTTMETDITESFEGSPPSPGPDDSFLSGLRTIRGRKSYKVHADSNPNPYVQMAYARAQATMNSSANVSANVAQGTRPTGTVVGRKRRPDSDPSSAEEAAEAPKRARLLERLARPFRTHSTPLPARRAAEIVGINTDLPLTAPVAAADPESLKGPLDHAPPLAPPPKGTDRDAKRCIVM